MVIGIGTDILRMSELNEKNLHPKDPFFQATYATEEAAQAVMREVPFYYYATRFAGKEAVFKCLGIASDGVSLKEIVILNDETGQPKVHLNGELQAIAEHKRIGSIKISLSYDKDYAIAYAMAQTEEEV